MLIMLGLLFISQFQPAMAEGGYDPSYINCGDIQPLPFRRKDRERMKVFVQRFVERMRKEDWENLQKSIYATGIFKGNEAPGGDGLFDFLKYLGECHYFRKNSRYYWAVSEYGYCTITAQSRESKKKYRFKRKAARLWLSNLPMGHYHTGENNYSIAFTLFDYQGGWRLTLWDNFSEIFGPEEQEEVIQESLHSPDE